MAHSFTNLLYHILTATKNRKRHIRPQIRNPVNAIFSRGRSKLCISCRSRRGSHVRMKPGPGERFEVDWGHFGALVYGRDPRKLCAFCLVECHSRKLYLEFTRSQNFETLVRCHIHAFEQMAGCA